MLALSDVSLEIGSGITGLLGPNGAGKSTLIKVLLGLVNVTGGEGEVLGYRLGRQTQAIRSLVGYMPEDDCYIAGVTGIEMVQFVAQLNGKPAIESLRRAHEILDFAGTEQERYRGVETYSTGMRQKLKFAQAIVHDPPFLILDEPTSGLDPGEREAMLSKIKTLANKANKDHKGVLISTHILPDVQAICDDVVIMVNGQVRLKDSLSNLRKPASPSVHVRTTTAPDRLLQVIQEAGGEAQMAEDGRIELLGVGSEASAKVWEWAKQAGVGIRSLTPARNSLEQVFIDAVREDRSAHS